MNEPRAERQVKTYRIIRNGLSVKRNVDIATDENLLALKVRFREVFDGLLGLQVERTERGAEGVCVYK